jgi:alpha-tubulin suppressor-like RCC1 family protein
MKPIKILASEVSSAVIMDDHEVYIWGGLLAHFIEDRDKKVFAPVKLSQFLPKVKELQVDDIFFDGSKLILKNNKSEVFVKGYGGNGELGLGKKKYRVDSLEKITLKFVKNEEILSIKNGNNFTVILTTLGNLYTFGDNRSGGLGNGHVTTYYEDGEYVTEIKGKDFNHYVPTKISLPKLRDNEMFNRIFINGSFVYAITNLNQAYYWGSQLFVARGKYTIKPVVSPTLMPLGGLAKDEYVLAICSTESSYYYVGALMLTNLGKLYYIGDPANTFKSLKPFLITKKENPLIHQINLKNTSLEKETITKVITGEHHFLCLTESGKVFFLGDLLNGSTYGYFYDQNLSTKVLNKNETFVNPFSLIVFSTLLPDEKITDISSGHYHVLVMTSKHRFFSWGVNRYGVVGNGKFTNYKWGDSIEGEDFNQPTPVEIFLK